MQGLGNVIWIVDLNRQSLDRVIPGIKASRLKRLFAGAGWHVLEAKYGTSLEAAMDAEHGEALRHRIDEMSNEEYQALIRVADGAELRRRLADVADRALREGILASVAAFQTIKCRHSSAILAATTCRSSSRSCNEADQFDDAPVVIFAYTVKGWGLPFAGDPLNHSQLLTKISWIRCARNSASTRQTSGTASQTTPRPARGASPPPIAWSRNGAMAPSMSPWYPRIHRCTTSGNTSTQEAFGRALIRLGEIPTIGERVITMSPDVATSTHLAGWINKAGVFSIEESHDYEAESRRMLRWQPSPHGQHIELGISEMNLFMALGQFGLTAELSGQPLIPIGTVYDPFVCRGLDALIYSLYVQSRMIFAGTPAGVSLSPEGGAHQSTVTPSLGYRAAESSILRACLRA